MKISKHFTREEFACKCGCGFDTVDVKLIQILESVREHFKRPVTINSGCRCDEYNDKVGGASKSQHKYGRAADIIVKGVFPSEVQKFLKDKYPGEYGIGSYNSFTHVDSRDHKARW